MHSLLLTHFVAARRAPFAGGVKVKNDSEVRMSASVLDCTGERTRKRKGLQLTNTLMRAIAVAMATNFSEARWWAFGGPLLVLRL
ncbi:MAG TPA: hypothetical protein VGO73_00280 [Pyrinomonadaceae bacterium]|nr:hypothetical protein [Pyrinomonadaceae bacterium]